MNRRVVRLVLVSSTLTVLASASRLALAQSVQVVAPPMASGSDDVVNLRDGSMVRGRISERRSDGSCVIVLLTGEIRTVSADQIASIGSSAPPVAPPPPQAPPPAPYIIDAAPQLSTQPIPGRVPMVVEAIGAPLPVGIPTGAMIHFSQYGTSVTPLGQPLCRTPCTLYVRPGPVSLWSGGDGRRPDLDQLSVGPSGALIRMHSSSSAGFTGGLYLAIFGGSFVIGGALLLTLGALSPSGADFFLPVGATFLGIGAVMMGFGIPLVVANPIGIVSNTPLGEPRSARTRTRTTWRWSAIGTPIDHGVMAGAAFVF